MTFWSTLVPDEILLMFFSYLPLQDIKCLRLVCHCFLTCSSQFLFWSLSISSVSRKLLFYRKISSDDLFRKGIFKIIYKTRLNHAIATEYDNVLLVVQLAPDAFDQCYSAYDLLCYGILRLPMLREIIITDRTVQSSPTISTTDLSTSSLGISQARAIVDQLSLFILLRALSTVHSKPQTFEELPTPPTRNGIRGKYFRVGGSTGNILRSRYLKNRQSSGDQISQISGTEELKSDVVVYADEKKQMKGP